MEMRSCQMITQCCLAAACFGFSIGLVGSARVEKVLGRNTKHHVRQRLPTSVPGILWEVNHIRLHIVNNFNTKFCLDSPD